MGDATERPQERPSEYLAQKESYSGKKKQHTLKNTILVDEDKKILFVGASVRGGLYHDFALFQKDLPLEEAWFADKELWVDLGYQGISKKYPIAALHIPHKKPRKSKKNPETSLSERQKMENKELGSFRVIVEHAIGGMKHFKILTHKLRTKSELFADKIIGICAGLYNFKLAMRLNN